jgi:hypothetical protein
MIAHDRQCFPLPNTNLKLVVKTAIKTIKEIYAETN